VMRTAPLAFAVPFGAAVVAALALTAPGARSAQQNPAHESHAAAYASYPVRVIWNGQEVAGFADMAGDVQPPPANAAGQRVHKPIVLERGLTQDPQFAAWISHGGGAQNLVIERVSGQTAQIRITLSDASPSDFRPTPGADSHGHVGIQRVSLSYRKIEWAEPTGASASDSWVAH
jgi:hypothetical protein